MPRKQNPDIQVLPPPQNFVFGRARGSTTYLDVLTAQQSLLSAQTELVQDRYDMAAAVISLYHALGGGVESH